METIKDLFARGPGDTTARAVTFCSRFSHSGVRLTSGWSFYLEKHIFLSHPWNWPSLKPDPESKGTDSRTTHWLEEELMPWLVEVSPEV